MKFRGERSRAFLRNMRDLSATEEFEPVEDFMAPPPNPYEAQADALRLLEDWIEKIKSGKLSIARMGTGTIAGAEPNNIEVQLQLVVGPAYDPADDDYGDLPDPDKQPAPEKGSRATVGTDARRVIFEEFDDDI